MHYALIGYATKDVVPDGFLWGGTVTYAGRVVSKLDIPVQIITCMEPDDSLLALEPRIQWHILTCNATTTFDNQYDEKGNRTQYLLARAQDIPAAAILNLNPPPDILHIAPLANEVDTESLHDTVPQMWDTWLVATPQGWMRRVDENNLVHKVDWERADEALPYLKAIVYSNEDVDGKDYLAPEYASYGATVLYTRGELGSILYANGEKVIINAAPTHVVDPTGAGDVVAAAFFIRYRETGDPLDAAIFGTAAASVSIESRGTLGLPDREAIEARLAIWNENDRIGK
jgi:sugar/nucleoside kinase (ribokinase family)